MYKKKLVLLTAFIFLTALVCTGCGSNSPEGVAKALVQSVIDEEPEKGLELCYDQEDGVFIVGLVALALDMTDDRKFKYEVVEKSENSATVQVTGKNDHLCIIELEKIDGKWLVTYVG